jgi:3-deoxy-manno-octulosonate cytidylyltransferase (CMP-KDO synthetase)
LVRLVASGALALGLDGQVVVASDDRSVLRAVEDLEIAAVITSPGHQSGTERVAEVLQLPEYSAFGTVVNLQCDQPFLVDPVVKGSLSCLAAGFPLGTVATRLAAGDRENPNRVKVAVAPDGSAKWFSRGAMPVGELAPTLRHVGVYAYTRDAILRWVHLPRSVEEQEEGLEQLRPLVNGMSIGVRVLAHDAPITIDTADDLELAQSTLNHTSHILGSRINA